MNYKELSIDTRKSQESTSQLTPHEKRFVAKKRMQHALQSGFQETTEKILDQQSRFKLTKLTKLTTDAAHTNLMCNTVIVTKEAHVAGLTINKPLQHIELISIANQALTLTLDNTTGTHFIHTSNIDKEVVVYLQPSLLKKPNDRIRVVVENTSLFKITLHFADNSFVVDPRTYEVSPNHILTFDVIVIELHKLYVSFVSIPNETLQHGPPLSHSDLTADNKNDLRDIITLPIIQNSTLGNLSDIPSISNANPGQILKLSGSGNGLEWYTPHILKTTVFSTNQPHINIYADSDEFFVNVENDVTYGNYENFVINVENNVTLNTNFPNGASGFIEICNSNSYGGITVSFIDAFYTTQSWIAVASNKSHLFMYKRFTNNITYLKVVDQNVVSSPIPPYIRHTPLIIYVGNGSTSYPYYSFYFDSLKQHQIVNMKYVEFLAGNTYTFRRIDQGQHPAHPFQLQAIEGYLTSTVTYSNPSNNYIMNDGDELTISLHKNDINLIQYACTIHNIMNAPIRVVLPPPHKDVFFFSLLGKLPTLMNIELGTNTFSTDSFSTNIPISTLKTQMPSPTATQPLPIPTPVPFPTLKTQMPSPTATQPLPTPTPVPFPTLKTQMPSPVPVSTLKTQMPYPTATQLLPTPTPVPFPTLKTQMPSPTATQPLPTPTPVPFPT